MKTVYLAGGCFWGIEEYFSRITGIISTTVGYANSLKDNPCYEEVCSGKINAVETVKIIYDNKIIPLEKILSYFFKVIDPTILNRQNNDVGVQYRTGIYYEKDEDKEIISNYIEKIKKNYKADIVTEIMRIINFYKAEEYHQNYLKKNPGGYCHIELD
ncbi:Peptide methionine sulfoxide reductase MsrA [Peptoniphilus sp. ING2-D1G]|nr:Peptide methionine sulfoxide reductase MsrA [Peptoniphilus sp. ING2-D1G]